MNNIDIETIIIIACLSVAAIIAILSLLSNNYIKSHATLLYDETLPSSQKCKDLGNVLLQKFQIYDNRIFNLGLDQKFSCSNSVLSNAQNNPIKFLIKYSNVSATYSCIENLDFCISYIGNLYKFNSCAYTLTENIKEHLPFIVKIFCSKNKIPFIVCDIDKAIGKIKEPRFTFSYVSPAGRSRNSFTIPVSKDVLISVRSELSGKLEKENHKKTQRQAMTNDLREAIKKRDNYTCCICGNSVYKEPNLLLEVDHIVPISKGGKTEASNLQTLCWRCNRTKSNK